VTRVARAGPQRVAATVLRKIRPKLERTREGLGAPFRGSSSPERHGVPCHVDVMHHTVSDVIHTQCGHAAML